MVSIANEGSLPFVFRPFGGHNLLIRNLVFATSYWSFGLDARPWFWTVYLTSSPSGADRCRSCSSSTRS
jgi:hypothetical protein